MFSSKENVNSFTIKNCFEHHHMQSCLHGNHSWFDHAVDTGPHKEHCSGQFDNPAERSKAGADAHNQPTFYFEKWKSDDQKIRLVKQHGMKSVSLSSKFLYWTGSVPAACVGTYCPNVWKYTAEVTGAASWHNEHVSIEIQPENLRQVQLQLQLLLQVLLWVQVYLEKPSQQDEGGYRPEFFWTE